MEEIEAKDFSLCITGTGPAGLILAIDYARRHLDEEVLAVEYGGENSGGSNRLDESIHVANLVNHHPPEECTNKGLGGTSATWGGRCVLYDEIDFLDRPVLGGECTWSPGLWKSVTKHLSRAAEYFECGSGPFNLHERPGGQRRIAENFVEGEVTDSVLERWSMPTRFGSRYAREIETLPNLSVVTGWEARELDSPDSTGKVAGMEFREVASGMRCRVSAKRFVLAAGAQESTRILLRNPQVFERVGGPPFALGRYYQGHVSGKIAGVRFYGDPKKTDYGFLRDADGTYARRRFQFSTEYLRRNALLNTAIWLDNPLYFNPEHRSGPMSFMYLAMITPILGRKLAPPAIAHSVTKGKITGIGAHFLNILRGLPGSLAIPASIFVRRYCLKRKLPGVFLYNPQNRYALHYHAEQMPDAENRMRLAADGETLVIDYRLTETDVKSVIATHRKLDAWLRDCGCGELEYWFAEGDLADAIGTMSRDGIHQVGTTRISSSPERGVVDEDLKIWGTTNVFVCSSSVFPTSGQANPTFLLGAFALRLAEHLSSHAAH